MSASTGHVTSTDRRPQRGLGWWLTIVVPAIVAYVPLLATKPGRVGADTKTYLYLDPSRLLAEAPQVWHESIGLGTVTHQNIGYLFPMGPYYQVMEWLGAPDWVAQRLWLASILFAAGMGVRFLLREIGWARLGVRHGGVLVAVLAYMCSPYFLAYAARISVILLPWAALPWLVALTARAVRRGGWRDPALFALVVLAVGGINATALLLIGLGPLAWIGWSVWVEREATGREALAAVGRIGVLTLATSLWWIAGLWAEGRYGLPVIRYTETYRTVTEASTAPEVLRGLGYWFFYGDDKLGPWIEPSVDYTNDVRLLALSYVMAVVGLVGLAVVRWRHRGFFCALVVIGALAAIGGHPWEEGSLLGDAFTAFTRTDAGLSLRSTPRAVPLVVLGTAVATGALVTAVGRAVPRLAWPAAGLVALLVVANMPPLWSGDLVAENLDRDEEIPAYWPEVATHLDEAGRDTRALAVPGTDFASYRWGNTVDPVLPGLMDRPYAARELFQWGSAQSADLLNAWDRRLHEDTMDPEAVAPIARLLGAGDLVVRNDLQYERYRIARPRHLWDLLVDTEGLGEPTGFGPTTPNVAGPEQTLVDEIELATPPDLPHPHAVEVVPVLDPLPIVRTRTTEHPLLLAGDGSGLVDAAAAGVLGPHQAVFSSPWFAEDPEGLDTVLGSGDTAADLVVTDTNRRQAHRWGGLREITGYTEEAGEEPLEYDPSDARLEVFPDAEDEHRTVTEQRRRPEPGITTGATVRARAYGNPVTYTPDDRPALALDGDPYTAWRVGALDAVHGERLIIDLDEPVTVDHVDLLQPITLQRSRWITRARLHLGDGQSVDVDLDASSRDEGGAGQTVTFPERTLDRLEIEVLETNVGRMGRYEGLSGVGFAEVRIPGVGIEELVRPPTALLDATGPASLDHRLSYLFTRLRSNPAEPVRGDEEERMHRLVDVPTDRRFSLRGAARLSTFVPDDAIDALLGVPGAEQGGITATSSHRLDGSLRARASAAVDGDPDTAWSNGYQQQQGAHLELRTGEPVTFDRLDLQVLADGRHSVPTRIRIEAATEGGTPVPVAAVDLPAVPDGTEPGSLVSLPVRLDQPITGDHLLVVVESVRQVVTRDWYSSIRTVMPVAIAELGIPGLEQAAPTGVFDSGCRDDLVSIDGEPLAVRVTGTVEEALDRGSLDVAACGEAPALDAGEHVLRTGAGRSTGIEVDRLLLASAAGGAALPGEALPRQVPAGPAIEVTEDGPVVDEAVVPEVGGPFWVVLAQSWSDGWHLEVDGVDQGEPVLADGFGNGWLVDAAPGATVELRLEWQPQRTVDVALVLSALAGVVALVLAVGARRRPARHGAVRAVAGAPDVPVLANPFGAATPVRTPLAWFALAATTVAVAVNLPVDGRWALVPLVAVALLALRWRRGAALGAVVAAGSLALAAAYIVLRQHRYHLRADFTWPSEFERVHVLGLIAVLALGIQAVRDLLARLGAGDPAGEPAAEPGDGGPGAPTDGGARPDGGPVRD